MLASTLISILAMTGLASTKPIAKPISAIDLARRADPPSFNDWNGIQSLDGFDNFNGRNNFNGQSNSQTVVVEEQQTVCRRQQVEVIQQRLVVLQEMAKRIITETICEVETQTIVLQQFQSGLSGFGQDISRQSGRQVGFDKNIAGQVGSLVNGDGSLNTGNLNFTGQDVGKNTIVPGGSNWNDASSPASVKKAADAAKQASNSTSNN